MTTAESSYSPMIEWDQGRPLWKWNSGFWYLWAGSAMRRVLHMLENCSWDSSAAMGRSCSGQCEEALVRWCSWEQGAIRSSQKTNRKTQSLLPSPACDLSASELYQLCLTGCHLAKRKHGPRSPSPSITSIASKSRFVTKRHTFYHHYSKLFFGNLG